MAALGSLRESHAKDAPLHLSADFERAIRLLFEVMAEEEGFVAEYGDSILNLELNEHGVFREYTLLQTLVPIFGRKLLEAQGGDAYEKFLVRISEAAFEIRTRNFS